MSFEPLLQAATQSFPLVRTKAGPPLGNSRWAYFANDADLLLAALAPDALRLLDQAAELMACNNARVSNISNPCNAPEEPLCRSCAWLASYAALVARSET